MSEPKLKKPAQAPKGKYVTIEEDVWVDYKCPDCGCYLVCPYCEAEALEPPLRPTQLATLRQLKKEPPEGK